MHIYYLEVINMKIELNQREVILLLDCLIQEIAFEDTAIDIGLLYNKVLEQTDINGYENIYL